MAFSYPYLPAPNVNTVSAFRNFPFSLTKRSILNFSGSGWFSVTCCVSLHNMLIQLVQYVLGCDMKKTPHPTPPTPPPPLSFTISLSLPPPLNNTWVHMSSIEVGIDHSILWQVVSLECSVCPGTHVRETDADETGVSVELMKEWFH